MTDHDDIREGRVLVAWSAGARPTVMGAIVFSVFGFLALAVSAVGLYGLLAFLVLVAVVAGLVPGLRATRVDPMVALRNE